jgi:phosphatidylglycerophosphate synthase
MVNKIPTDLDNPIDVILYNQVDRDLDFYKKLGLTPNGLTTISLILTLAGIYNFYKEQYFLGALLFFIGYYFDCADGKMARKYKMFSKYGDLYDHYSDFIKILLLFFVFYKKSPEKFKKIVIISIILYILLLLYTSCQEKIYGKKKESNYLNFFTIDLDNCEEKIKYLRYFAPGTSISFLTLCILFWNKI